MIETQKRDRWADIPLNIRLVLTWFGLSYVYGFASKVATSTWTNPQSDLIALALIGTIGAWYIYGIYRRQNWLRWLTLVLNLFVLIDGPYKFLHILQGRFYLALSPRVLPKLLEFLALAAINLFAVYCLFSRKGSAWFMKAAPAPSAEPSGSAVP